MFNRLNQALLRYIDRKRRVPRIEAVESTRDGFTVTWQAHTDQPSETAHHVWGDIRRVAAILVPGLLGGDECLLVDVDGSVLQLTVEVAGFEAFIEEGAKRLNGWRPVTEWRLTLAAASPGHVVDVYG
ncbi:hypothetical protein FAZ69_25845 [Trinickia terrae]|uniref:Uncharacterized protein n=1 Tax=Trinickia terrae TaxID=2571161 RepID=A0A4U1HP18_9BURK|nr:hypothetical protein [Trinickia terrae]TKC83115.1 hypothetical protein FAZ69_25845 [Trinickia terrae]